MHLLNFDKDRKFRLNLININKLKIEKLYDYGEGSFYQSLPAIKLNGLRDTSKRIEKLNLNELIYNKNILDIGTNIGAIPLSINQEFTRCVGIDHNKSVIEIANEIKTYLNKNKIEFICDDFLNHHFEYKFDVVLSLANHSTFDKGITDTVTYFHKIKNLLSEKGLLVLESHSPLYENKNLYLSLVNSLKKNFEILKSGKYDFGNFYDRDRIFHILRKK